MFRYLVVLTLFSINAFAKIPIYAPEDGTIELWQPADHTMEEEENPEEYKQNYRECMKKKHSVVKAEGYCIEYYILIFYAKSDTYKCKQYVYELIDKLDLEYYSYPNYELSRVVKKGDLVGYATEEKVRGKINNGCK